MSWVHTKIKNKTKYGLCSGMTFIEVIIAIALMSILVMGILTALTNQITLLDRSKDITVNSFSNQSEVEEAIENVRSNSKFIDSINWPDTVNDYVALSNRNDATVTEEISGQQVRIYKMELTDSKGKTTRAYLSPSLARDQNYQINLEAKEVNILVDDDDTQTVALITGASTPTVVGRYTIKGTNYYASVCKWYASIPGVISPQWPHDYEQIIRTVKETGLSPDHEEISLHNINDYANRYVVFSVQPADGNGIRGAEVVSKSVLIQGVEWRDGNFPWADKNGNNKFDGFAVDKDAELLYYNIDGVVNYNTFEVSLGDVEKMDIKNSSLFVPRGVGDKPIYNSEVYPHVNNGNIYEKDIVANNAIEWVIENGIHFANKIISNNPVTFKTDNGQIVFYRFVKLKADGSAELIGGIPQLKDPGSFNFADIYSSTPSTPRLYQNLGSEISSLNNVYLGAYGIGKGFIFLQPFSSINGANVVLEAEEPITIYNSALSLQALIGDNNTMNREILLTSIKDISIRSLAGFTPNYIKGNPPTKSAIKFNTNQNVLVENAVFKDIDISLLGNGIFKDVIWDSTKSITVKDGKTLTFSKANHEKVKNNGILNLGDTGSISATGFADVSDMFENPLGFELNTTAISNEIQISTTSNFIRNIGYADASTTILTTNYQSLGVGNTNLDIKAEPSVANLRCIFDGTNKITVVADELSLGQSAQSTITIRDRYAPMITKNITVLITGGTNGNSYTFQQ